jgi:hypothetical protein
MLEERYVLQSWLEVTDERRLISDIGQTVNAPSANLSRSVCLRLPWHESFDRMTYMPFTFRTPHPFEFIQYEHVQAANSAMVL